MEGKKKKEKRKNDYPKIITDRKKKKRDENVNIDPLIKCLENTFGKFEINIRTQWNEKKKMHIILLKQTVASFVLVFTHD